MAGVASNLLINLQHMLKGDEKRVESIDHIGGIVEGEFGFREVHQTLAEQKQEQSAVGALMAIVRQI